ncbi:MAG: hypothetical protein ACI8XO_001846 [Verrucomicrobiales bacterium]|jgi:hypothetical protein
MPEDDDNDFDLDLDLDLGIAPEKVPPIPQPAPNTSPPTEKVPPSPALPKAAPAVFRKREQTPAPTPAPTPIPQPAKQPTPQAQQAPQAPKERLPGNCPPPRPGSQKAPTPTPAPASQPPIWPPPHQNIPPVKSPVEQQVTRPPSAPKQAPTTPRPPEQPIPSPAKQAPAQQAPATQTPATQTPATQTPATQTPAKPRPSPASPTPATESRPASQPQQTPVDSFLTKPPAPPKDQEIIPREPEKKHNSRKLRPETKNERRSPKQKPAQVSNAALLKKKLLIGIPLLIVLGLIAFKFVLPKKTEPPILDVDKIQSEAAKKTSQKSSAGDPAYVPGSGDLPPVDRSNETPDELDERAQNTLASFFGANKKESLPPYIRQPLRVSALMKDYYSRKPFPTDEEREFLGLKSDLQQADAIGPDFYSAEADLGGPRSHTMILEDTPKGFRVDWEYHVQYNPMDWSTFIKEAPTPPMDFRVYARIVPDNRAPFTDEERYLAIELMTLNDTSVIIGYVERANELGKRMQAFLKDKAEELCILRLEFPSGSEPGDTAVYIRELVNPHWIITDDTSGN